MIKKVLTLFGFAVIMLYKETEYPTSTFLVSDLCRQGLCVVLNRDRLEEWNTILLEIGIMSIG